MLGRLVPWVMSAGDVRQLVARCADGARTPGAAGHVCWGSRVHMGHMVHWDSSCCGAVGLCGTIFGANVADGAGPYIGCNWYVGTPDAVGSYGAHGC